MEQVTEQGSSGVKADHVPNESARWVVILQKEQVLARSGFCRRHEVIIPFQSVLLGSCLLCCIWIWIPSFRTELTNGCELQECSEGWKV